MTHSSNQQQPRRRFRGGIPAFLPVPLRGREDGWTAIKQGEFIGFLAETGSVAQAARMVGMSRKGAYALRARSGAEGFAAAWDVALGMPKRKVTPDDLMRLAYEGTVQPLMRRGVYRGTVRKPSISALLKLMDRLDRSALRHCGGWAEGA